MYLTGANELWRQKESSEVSESEIDAELNSCDSYNDEILRAIALLENKKDSGITSDSNENTHGRHIKYPTLPLPQYSHAKGEGLEKFFMDFEKAMDTMNVDSYIKFIYLQRQLSGQPLALVKSLSSTEQTYEEAKSLLEKAFGSTILKKFETLCSLSELTLTNQGDPYEFIGKMRTIKNSFVALKISIDDVLQYFFWVAMSEGLKSQVTAVTNKNKPSLKEIEDTIFEATERYIANQTKHSEKKKSSSCKVSNESTSLAINANPNSKVSGEFRSCILCSKDGIVNPDHPIYKCQSYESPVAKVKKLESLGACVVCANLHKDKECRYRFKKKCSKCGKWHFSFLCNQNSSKSNPAKSKDKAEKLLEDVDDLIGQIKSKND